MSSIPTIILFVILGFYAHWRTKYSKLVKFLFTAAVLDLSKIGQKVVFRTVFEQFRRWYRSLGTVSLVREGENMQHTAYCVLVVLLQGGPSLYHTHWGNFTASYTLGEFHCILLTRGISLYLTQ